MPLTPEEFGQKIKAKHPEYADIPDGELAQKVLAKYPEYQDMVSTAPATNKANPPQPPGFGQSFGRAVGAPTTPEEASWLLADPSGVMEGSPRSTFNPPKGANLPGGLNLGNAALNIVENMGRGIGSGVKSGTREMREAFQNIRSGGPILSNIGKGVSGYADILSSANPIIGAGSQAGEQVRQGNLKGAAGSFTGGVVSGGLMMSPLRESSPANLMQQKPSAPMRPAVAKPGTPVTTPTAPHAAIAPSTPLRTLGVSTALKAAEAAVSRVEPLQALTKAIKPGTNDSGWNAALAKAAPELARVARENGQPIVGIDSLVGNIKYAKKQLWQEYSQKLDQAMKVDAGPLQTRDAKTGRLNATTNSPTIDGGAVADVMKKSIDKRYRMQNPAQAEALDKVAETYRRPLTLQEAEEFLQSANNDLHSYYAKNKVGQKVAQGDPSISNVVAESEALRSALYGKLDQLTGPGAAQLKQRYGALSHIEEAALKRQNVAARQQPDSLQETINITQGAVKVAKSLANAHVGDAIEGAGQMAVSRWFKERNSTDGLIKGAFEKLGGSEMQKSPKARPSSTPKARAASAGVGAGSLAGSRYQQK